MGTKFKRFRKIVKIFLKTVVVVAFSVVAVIAAFLVYSTLTDFKPAAEEKIEPQGFPGNIMSKNEYTFVSWNIGYCGLGREMDFFYEGGKSMRPGNSLFQQYLNDMYGFMTDNDSVDFFLLQEVDRGSRRSYYTDQAQLISDALASHGWCYAANYRVKFVPLPLYNPMGPVEGGLMSLFRFRPRESHRYAYPLSYDWPMKVFMLDRCFIINRMFLDNGRQLVVINTHNSAFSDAGDMRRYELWMLRGFLLSEYEKGNYVVAGGDWNQNPPGSGDQLYYGANCRNTALPVISDDILPPDWTWAYDPHYPTNRDVKYAYIPGSTPTTTYDFFVVSPNVEIRQVNVIRSGFVCSDHEPVYLRVRLIETDTVETLDD